MADVNFQGDGSRRRTYILAGVVLVAVLIIGALVLTQGQQLLPSGASGEEPGAGENESDPFEEYASADEESGTTDTEGATIGATITIDEFGVTPARASIQVGEAVRWENNRDVPVRLEFDRTSQTPTIQPGGTLEMRFRAVTYYDVVNADTGDKITGGSIATE